MKIFGLFESETSKRSVGIIMTNPQGIITNFNSGKIKHSKKVGNSSLF